MENPENEHPIFARVRALPPELRELFPTTTEEAAAWTPTIRRRTLASRVLVVARTRIECAWSAYCDAVPGQNHLDEVQPVLDHGAKVPEAVARALFPEWADVRYHE